MHSPQLLEHFREPRNVGDLEPPAMRVDVVNPACGDSLRLWVLWEDGRIARAAYRMRGCTASIAAGSVLTELLAGRTAAELRALDAGAAVNETLGGLPAESGHVAVLCADAVRELLRQYAPR